MKKIFLIAVVLLMMINFIINYHHEVTKEKHTPMADFKTKVEMAPMKEYNDPDFGYVILKSATIIQYTIKGRFMSR